MKKNKVVIITLVTFIFFALGGGCYYFFCLLDKNKKEVSVSEDKNKEVGVPEDKNKKEVSVPKDVYEIAQNDVSSAFQKIADYEQKIAAEKNINQWEDIDKSIKILQNQGIYEELSFESDYKKYLDAVESSQEAAKLKLDELLEKVKKKEKDLASFREELEKISEEIKKNISENTEMLADLIEKIHEEAKKPVPFFATWIGLVISVITCPVVSFFILKFLKEKKFTSYCCSGQDQDRLTNIGIFIGIFFAFFLQFLIFPLINCLLSLKMSSFREIYKHWFYNRYKFLFLIFFFFFLNFIIGGLACSEDSKTEVKFQNIRDQELSEIQ